MNFVATVGSHAWKCALQPITAAEFSLICFFLLLLLFCVNVCCSSVRICQCFHSSVASHHF